MDEQIIQHAKKLVDKIRSKIRHEVVAEFVKNDLIQLELQIAKAIDHAYNKGIEDMKKKNVGPHLRYPTAFAPLL